MEIKKGIYVLKTDSVGNVWIEEEYTYTVKNKETKVEEEKQGSRRVCGYVSSFLEAKQNFLKLKMKNNDARSIEEVLNILAKEEERIDRMER